MEFSLLAALAAGLVATLVMSGLMRLASMMGMTQMPPMPVVTGAMMSGDRRTATAVGLVLHYVVMGTVVFGLVYGAIFTAVGSASVVVGLLIGLVHAVIVGAMAMPMMPAVHPRMKRAPVPAGGGSPGPDADVELSSPGVFGARWGAMTPAGLVIGHLVYGAVAALMYQWIA